jgi:hypothetical protein
VAKQIVPQTTQDTSQQDLIALTQNFSRSLGIETPVFKCYTGMHFGEQSKYVSIRFDEKQVRKWGQLELIHITDCQYGHMCCNVEYLEQFIKWVLSEPNRFVIGGGDFVDAAHIGSPGGPYDNLFKPQTGVYKFCHLFSPLAHRIISFVGGNHERRPNLYFGDLGTLLATLLQTPYSAGQQFVDVHFGKWAPFKINNWHGKGAAQTIGSQVLMVEKHIDKHPDAHFYPVGHLHQAFLFYRSLISRNHHNLKLDKETQCGLMSSSFLDWTGSYAEIADLREAPPLMGRVILYPDHTWEVSHTLSLK